jgi:ubiquinone/menaquinone biosynthesis C-methylase UbiE
MPWYDWFATYYDHTVEHVYARYRAEAVAVLRVAPGDHVVDLACGTGPNFEHLVAAVGERGRVVGVDFSSGMLERAARRAARHGWSRVSTLQQDARTVRQEDLDTACGAPVRLAGVLVTLGLSVIPDWEAVVRQMYERLQPGGRFVVFDIHTQRWVPSTWIVKVTAQADTRRRAWPLFEQLGAEVTWRYLSGSPHVHGGTPYLAVARKPA